MREEFKRLEPAFPQQPVGNAETGQPRRRPLSCPVY
jgi:hypothetical protein